MKHNSSPRIDTITVEELNKILAEKDEEARRIVDRVFGPKQSPADIVDEFLKNKRTRRTKAAASLWTEEEKDRKKPGHEESQLQQLCVAWFRSSFPAIAPLLIAVPNAARRNARTGAILKREGLTAGVADLILLVGRGEFHSLCIEMKTHRKGSGQSDKQIQWEQVAEDNGNKYVVCRDLEEFKITVSNYLFP
ncbi:MAG: VRR-NUC domain-containing protein [Oscillibacter sp.]|nr:VRR-NUC domain-containing protein [Oscillibacter sp.]